MTNEEIEKGVKISCSVSDDGEQGFIFNEASEKLFARINFYESGFNLSIGEKKAILEKTVHSIFETIENEDEKRKSKSWSTRCEAFKDAYQYEPKEKGHIVWLMTSILDLSREEADRRWAIASDLMQHPDFKDKQSIVMNKVYLNNKHLKNSDLDDVEYIRTN